MLTADHGCDLSWHGTNHTWEHVPIQIYTLVMQSRLLVYRNNSADIGQTIESYFGLSRMEYGKNIL